MEDPGLARARGDAWAWGRTGVYLPAPTQIPARSPGQRARAVARRLGGTTRGGIGSGGGNRRGGWEWTAREAVWCRAGGGRGASCCPPPARAGLCEVTASREEEGGGGGRGPGCLALVGQRDDET